MAPALPDGNGCSTMPPASHIGKTVMEWPEVHDKELKVSSWTPNSQIPIRLIKSDPCRPNCRPDWALTHQGIDIGPLGSSCGFWHQGIGGRSVEFCRLPGGNSMDQTCWETSYRWAGQYGSQVKALSSLSHSSRPFLSSFSVWQGTYCPVGGTTAMCIGMCMFHHFTTTSCICKGCSVTTYCCEATVLMFILLYYYFNDLKYIFFVLLPLLLKFQGMKNQMKVA